MLLLREMCQIIDKIYSKVYYVNTLYFGEMYQISKITKKRVFSWHTYFFAEDDTGVLIV